MNFLEIVHKCHNDNPWQDETLIPFYLSPPPFGVQIGFLRDVVVKAIEEEVLKRDCKTFTLGRSVMGSSRRPFVAISAHLITYDEKSSAMRSVVESWRERGLFPDPLNGSRRLRNLMITSQGWRNELYTIYGPSPTPPADASQRNPAAFALERAACALFGLATFGVHATAYTPAYKIWVPRRASTKSTFPGMLDNSVAGGISAGDTPFESIIRECYEEAGLHESLVRSTIKQAGVVSYFYRTASGWCQPEVEYTYDIALDEETKPMPIDGEAESFELLDIDEILALMRHGHFKPNCAIVLIDFFIRHGFLTYENCDCDYLELVCSLHNSLGLPCP